VVSSVDRPVNVLAGLAGMDLDLAALSGLGVKRVSVGSALARVAFGAFLRAAEAMRTRGAFELGDAVSYADLSGMFDP
jgi:2-methylisocitrate lyase-like PEP mutase family enzyme